MRLKIALALLLFCGLGSQCHGQASPYSNSVFPAQIFTATGQTGTTIQLNGLVVPSTVGSSFASGTITVTGTSLATVTFSLRGSSDNGLTFYPLPMSTVATPTTVPVTTVTATANGLYQVNLAGLTHVRFVTSGTFTATSVSIVLTASPNALVSRNSGGGGGGTTLPAGSPGDMQFNLDGTNLGADSGNLRYIPSTHTLVTLNQFINGTLLQSPLDTPVAAQINPAVDGPSDAFGNAGNSALLLTPRSWGVGKNVGPNYGNSADGWRTLLGLDIEMSGGTSGIHQGLHIGTGISKGSGDSAAIYSGNGGGFSPCMWTDASGEGCVGININGTQNDCIATGTIGGTPVTGDRNPVFNITPINCNGANALINDGIIIDTSVTLLHTALIGSVSVPWEATSLGSLAVTPGTAVLSTGIGVLTANIPLPTVYGQYQTQSFSASIHDSLPLAVGSVFVLGGSQPEQCNILTVSPGPSSPQAGTISCAKFHPAGAFIFQGGSQGFGDFDDDITTTGLHSVLYTLGATDTNHLIIAQRQGGQFIGQSLPYRGGEAAGLTLTGGFTVHPGALCVSTNFNNTACTLEFNTVAWSTGHLFASPTGIPTAEAMGSFTSSQNAPDSPQSGGTGFTITFRDRTQHGAAHPFISMVNAAALSKYANSGVGSGWLSAPPGLDVQGPMGNLLQFDYILPDTSFGAAACNGPQAAVICYKNAPHLAPNFNLFTDRQGPEKIQIDGVNSRFRFLTWGISAPAAEFGTATVNAKQICLLDGTNCPASSGGITALTGDCAASGTGSVGIICTKTNGTPFAASATTDTTNANNITSGTVNAARIPTSLPAVSIGGNAATATGIAGTAAANTIYQGPYSGGPAAPGFHALISSQVTGALGYVPYQTPTLVGNLATGVIADYQFNSGSGTILVDASGNGNNGTFGAGALAPAWTQGGVQFTGVTSEGIMLPSAINAGKTFVIAAYWSPITTMPCGVNWTTAGACPAIGVTVNNVQNFPAWITDSSGSNGLNFVTSVDAEGFGQPMTWNGSSITRANGGFSGFHVIVWVLGTGGGDLDHIYVDGAEVSYSQQGANAGVAGGNLFIGSSNAGPWTQSSPQAIFYRMRVHSTQYTAADAQAITQVFRADISNRGVPTSPQSPLLGAPQLHCVGDSITAGVALVTRPPFCGDLVLTNQPTYTVSNWGVSGAKLQQFASSEPNRVAQLCHSTTGPQGVVHIMAGVNDFISGGLSAPVLYSFLQGEVQSLKSGGCKVFVSTLLDFGGGDAQKNAYNNLIRTGIVASGADGIDDMAADPILGADGASANATFFSGGLHPTDAGEVHEAAAMSNTLNYYFGSTPANPTLVTSATYSMLSGDAYLLSQPTANQTLTLPNCLGPTGAVYTVNNSQSAFTVGIKNLVSAEPINGVDHSASALSIPSNSTMRFRDVALPSSTGGCVWNSF